MSAREEARKAVHGALLPTPLGTYKDTLYRSRAADAASDVWEAHYRDLWHAYAGLIHSGKVPAPSAKVTMDKAAQVLGYEL